MGKELCLQVLPTQQGGFEGIIEPEEGGVSWEGSGKSMSHGGFQSQQMSLGWLQHPRVRRIPLPDVFLKISMGKPGLKHSGERGEHIDLLELLIQVHKTGTERGLKNYFFMK